MADMKEIQTRMKSIQDTMKITNAMYLISSSKLKKARKNLEATEPYFLNLQKTIMDILVHTPDIDNKYFDQRSEIKSKDRKKGYIVITADKGLAGAYNHNIFKLVDEEHKKDGEHILFVVGQMGRQYYNRKKIPIDVEFLYTAQDPSLYRARSIEETVLDMFNKKALDEVYVIYTRMITPMKSEPEMIQVLPLKRAHFAELENEKYHHFASFSPSPKVVLEHLVPNYVKGVIYGALVEAFSSEQNARMTAMEGATNSAQEMLKKLSLQYNRARQGAITQEITEIVSGAKAFKK